MKSLCIDCVLMPLMKVLPGSLYSMFRQPSKKQIPSQTFALPSTIFLFGANSPPCLSFQSIGIPLLNLAGSLVSQGVARGWSKGRLGSWRFPVSVVPAPSWVC